MQCLRRDSILPSCIRPRALESCFFRKGYINVDILSPYIREQYRCLGSEHRRATDCQRFDERYLLHGLKKGKDKMVNQVSNFNLKEIRA